MRWGGGEEAFWGNYFNGYKDEKPWATQLPLEGLTETRRPIEIFGFKIPRGERPTNLGRPFKVRFGDIARIDAVGDGVWAALETDGSRAVPTAVTRHWRFDRGTALCARSRRFADWSGDPITPHLIR